ncbi:hypothetical protein ADEAN_000515500 [Angomonas deanei]|uniref:Uncharacterized protein n=1 Tax=Angomonas deanei TaxID=59799 RepID=A0A7G2CE64_9TRYP|nr:hypothetical protein ADEAN_000515500 [Angomonas deanei]
MTDSLSSGDLFLIHLFLFASNCFSSVVQGLTGFGDAIMLHVLFQVVCASQTSIFRQTPLGEEPFRIVVILMYVRIIFSAPLLAYWSLKDGLFSKTMTLMMAVPSTLTALIGVVWASNSGDDMLKMILGISSLVFAILYVLIIVVRFVMKRMRRKKLVEVLDQGGQDPSQESTVVRIERGKDVVIVNESQLVQRMHNDSFASMPGALQRDENGDGHAPLGSLQVNRNSDSRLGEEYSSEGVEVLESVRGSPFSADEARIPSPHRGQRAPAQSGEAVAPRHPHLHPCAYQP